MSNLLAASAASYCCFIPCLVYVGKNRASWNPELEKSLVKILPEHKDTGARGDNGCWSSEGWTKMIKEFHARNKYINFNRNQI